MEREHEVTTRSLSPLMIYLLSVLVGVIAGLGAVIFRGLIGLFHNLLFLGTLSIKYNANVHTPASPWGMYVILVPIAGSIGVAFLVKNFAPEAKGHGVPEVMEAIYYERGIIRPVVAAVKAVASALSIGSGGSIGREGPIIQIGSSFGSTVGQILKTPPWQTITLIAAGAGGGIAATFNTPIGGVLFAVEIMLHEVSVRTLVPVTISTATAAYVGRLFFGNQPSFVIPRFEAPYFHADNPLVLLPYVGLGLIMGLVSVLFIRSIYAFEDFFDERIGGSYYRRHLIGMSLVGIMMVLLMTRYGHYYIEGVGYSTVQDILSGSLSRFDLLFLLFVLKLLATSLTLGSGASGGVFSPCLFLGGALGEAYGLVAGRLFPGHPVSPQAFAVAGMAGVVGGATGAAMAAIVMIFEMTLDYNVIIPMTITVAISYGIRKVLSPESIYTLKLVRRGRKVPDALQASVHQLWRAREVMQTGIAAIPAATTLDELVRILPERPDVRWFLAVDSKGIVAVVERGMAASGEAATLAASGGKDFIIVGQDAPLSGVMQRMSARRASIALVSNGTEAEMGREVVGVITKERIGEIMVEAVDLFSDA
ncbi:MAG TPA: chloride channel protein [Nitrospiria bacterium]|nr:chloride channel protein [Nitrospiria bacterium]